MYFYNGDKVIDATGKEFFDGTKPEDVQWPIKLYNAPCKWVSLDFNIVEITGPYKFKFEAKNIDEFNDKQDDRW